ncbi:uncharacterized protein NECHADRAFT_75508 [Fusarium vanettenii 77-13-4]|uniref:RxLR effector candidate protein n=1 Tax=Fusarium vanettenii (strain ATCC MYA-4622 / CBS 123669 / FGSC 9596 / NRRL 45880 / 77-13-4) TaxID=660122 RepID=C7YJ04_FUSV7|nr:uncharacterized protein NECHADRAFT_75508 [Fusarium vanettenii 77-13-4]EEU48897.1 predicted protein [Fusarium vanettenii 77-13-4]
MRAVALLLFALEATLAVAVALPSGHRGSCGCSRNGRRDVTVLEQVGDKKIVSEELIIPESHVDELKGSKGGKSRELHTRDVKPAPKLKPGQRLGLSSQQLQKVSTLDKSTRRRAATFLGFSKEVQQLFGESDPPFSTRAVYLLEKELEQKAKLPRLRGILERYDAIPVTPKDDKEPPLKRSEGDLFDTSRLPKELQSRDLEKRQSAMAEPRFTDEQVLKLETIDKKTRNMASKYLKLNPALHKLFVHNGPPYQPWVLRIIEKELTEKAKKESVKKVLDKFDLIPKAIFMDNPKERRSVGDELVNNHLEGQQHSKVVPRATNDEAPEQSETGQKHRDTEESDAKAAYDYKVAEKMKEIKEEGWCEGLQGMLQRAFTLTRNPSNGEYLVAKNEFDCFWKLYLKGQKWKAKEEDLSVANDGAAHEG